MTSKLNTDTNVLSNGDLVMNSTVILRRSTLDDTSRLLSSFLASPSESEAERSPQLTIPYLTDYHLPSHLLYTRYPQISALLSDCRHQV